MLSHPHNHQLQQPYASSVPLQHNSNQQPIVYYVIRRTGEVVAFNSNKIITAVTKVYISVHGTNYVHSSSLREHVGKLATTVMQTIQQRHPTGGSIHIEEIQDNVERILMMNGEHDIARAYILYREQHKQHRLADVAIIADKVVVDNPAAPHSPILAQLAAALPHTSADLIQQEVAKELYTGASAAEVCNAYIMAAKQYIEVEPQYSLLAARLLLNKLWHEVSGIGIDIKIDPHFYQYEYKLQFIQFITNGINAQQLNPALAEFDLDLLAAVLDANRDLQFKYLGLQTLYDRYFLHISGRRIELPQFFFMRVAMGLALNEPHKNKRAIEFYLLISSFDFMPSTPTLFNAGTTHSQLSSCYISTVADSLSEICDSYKDNGMLSKFAGGLGNDWTPVRALGATIKGTNGQSQGVIPFLSVVNALCVAVNQGGKRRGSACVYLETWHADIEEFVELRRTTGGDDRRRTHDLNTAHWIPDLFMQRVQHKQDWSLFSPDEVPRLHDTVGQEFNILYCHYEVMGQQGKLKIYKRIPAVELWRKMLSMLFETGHPWFTFKDACNIRSPQQHVGMVHSSNLCTEITLNTNAEEIAVCNLGSVNLANHITAAGINHTKLQATITTAMRMLDNVIDVNFYPVDKAANSNKKHRPVGLGMMGFQDCLYLQQIPYGSEEAVSFADVSTEAVAYYAYRASAMLAQERGTYSTYKGSLWDRGILPQDSLELLAQQRGAEYLQYDTSSQLDWQPVRDLIAQHGMRNSNCLAIAPTATIANIVGVFASIEPNYQNIFVKSNLSGEFTVANEQLVHELKKLQLWDEVMRADLKYFNGSVQPIERIPPAIKQLYTTAFEIEPKWLIAAAARRQKWIDQSQSLNLYIAQANGKLLHDTYMLAWTLGLKTTYYLRTLGSTSAEKSTGRVGILNAVTATGQQGSGRFGEMCRMDEGCEVCE